MKERHEQEQQALAMMQKARMQISMEFPLFGALQQRLKLRIDWRCNTLYTDGLVIGFNPAYICGNTIDEVIYKSVHEVDHCVFSHPFRTRSKKDRDIWNQACDHAVNLMLNRDERLKKRCPKEALCDDRFEALTADAIYDILLAEREQQKAAQAAAAQAKQKQQSASSQQSSASAEGEGEGEEEQEEEVGEGTECGDVIAPGEAGKFEDEEQDSPYATSEDERTPDDLAEEESEDEAARAHGGGGGEGSGEAQEEPQHDAASDEAMARDWAGALAAAALAAGAGSEGQVRAIQEQLAPRQSYEEEMEQFVVQQVREYEDWGHKNRRFPGVYLPSIGGIGTQSLIFVVDTSASISRRQLAQFQNATQRIAEEAKLRRCIIMYCDERVHGTEVYEGIAPRFAEPKGAGGTAFAPAFEAVRDLIGAGEDVAGVVYLTDQENYDPDPNWWGAFCDIPTLWVNPGKARAAPFGRACSMLV